MSILVDKIKDSIDKSSNSSESYLQLDSSILFELGLEAEQNNNYQEMIKYYEYASIKGSSEAMFNLANYYKKLGDNDNMVKYYQQGADCCHIDSIFELGKFYMKTENYDVGEMYLVMSAELGHIDSAFLLGKHYENKKNYEQMKKYYQICIDKRNCEESKIALINYYSKVEKNRKMVNKLSKELDSEVILSNMDKCINAVPYFMRHIYDIDTNPYLLEKFTKELYSNISSTIYGINELKFFEKMCPGISYIPKNKNTTIYDSNLNIINTFESPYLYGVFNNNQLSFCYDKSTKQTKCKSFNLINTLDEINKCSRRYICYELVFIVKNNCGHSIALMLDKKTSECYIIDSNNNNTFEMKMQSKEYPKIIDKHIKYITDFLGFNLISLEERNIELNVNSKIKHHTQQKFFRGYCRGWTIFFIIMAGLAPDDFEMLDFLMNFQIVPLQISNQIIQIFQVWYVYTANLEKKNPKEIQKKEINEVMEHYFKNKDIYDDEINFLVDNYKEKNDKIEKIEQLKKIIEESDGLIEKSEKLKNIIENDSDLKEEFENLQKEFNEILKNLFMKK